MVKKPDNLLWQCKDGRLLRLSEMTLSHLNYSIAKVLHGNGWRHEYTESLLNELERRQKLGVDEKWG